MLKKIICVCGEEMELKRLDVRRENTTYTVEAEYVDDSHTCTVVGEFFEDEIINFLECKQEGEEHGQNKQPRA